MMKGQHQQPPAGGLTPPGLALPRPAWLQILDEQEWRAFQEIVERAAHARLEILVGGAVGLAAYMPLLRRTKDVDFYVLPSDRETVISLLAEAGFGDLYDRLPYDRGWIYRSVRDDVIVDVIWCFANKHAVVDRDWFTYCHEVKHGDGVLRVVAPEELIWSKLFVLQRERCDWPDLLNLLYYTGPTLNWERLRSRLGPDSPLLDALLAVFSWMCPETPPAEGRAALLDSRAWFLPDAGAPLNQ